MLHIQRAYSGPLRRTASDQMMQDAEQGAPAHALDHDT